MRTKVLWSWTPFFIVMFFCIGSAYADNVVPDPASDTSDWVRAIYMALTSGDYKLVAGLGLLGMTWGLRVWAGNVWPWLKTKNGGMVLAFAISLTATLGTAFAAGANPNLPLFVSTLTTAATAAGLWGWLKDRFESVQNSVQPNTPPTSQTPTNTPPAV